MPAARRANHRTLRWLFTRTRARTIFVRPARQLASVQSPGRRVARCSKEHVRLRSDPFVAHYLIADTGSDPIDADALALKREAPTEQMATGPGLGVGREACKLANAFLAQRRSAVPESVVPADWNPKSFECAVNHVAMVRRGLGRFPEALALIGLIRLAIGRAAARGDDASLPCPAPSGDPEGRYRVVLRFGLPIIERLADSGEWAWIESDRITIDPPAPG